MIVNNEENNPISVDVVDAPAGKAKETQKQRLMPKPPPASAVLCQIIIFILLSSPLLA